MTKHEFLSTFTDELKRKNVADAADIISEYEQHFAFKMADGLSEEEIAAKLGNAISLASQFEGNGEPAKYGGRKMTTIMGLCFADLFAGIFFVLLGVWEVIMVAFSLACGAVAVCLFGGFSIPKLIPTMPYWCGAVLGLSMAALAVLAAVGCMYFAALLRQLMRSFGRFHHNTLAAVSGKAILPPHAMHSYLDPKLNRRMRSIALTALIAFVVSFILGIFVCMTSARAIEFWHTWGWFGYTGI